MLVSLDIRDVLIIDRLSLAFQPGLNVLTGETGAGKSILLDALGFVLGWRGRAELVRQGAAQGEVEAVFELPAGHPAFAVLDAAGLEAEGELILRRVNTADGRKTAWVNGRRATGELLRDLSDTLVELHGQHDDRGLLNPRGHRLLLDTFGQIDTGPARRLWRARSEARSALEAAQSALSRAQAEEDFLRHAVGELDKLNPEPGEEATLDARRRLMQGAERIRADIARAHGALADGAGGAMRDALRWLEGASDKAEGRLDGALAALNRAILELSDAEAGVEDTLRSLDFNPSELEALEERLFAIRALARKYGVLPDDLGTHAETLRGRLAAIDGGVEGLAKLERAVAEADRAYTAEAMRLTKARREAAKRLDAAMAAELAPLKMERAVFATEVTTADPGPDGVDAVTFTVATNPGAPSGPLNRIASGGELSRFLLALKVCLTGEAPGMTLIFDEIDRGVGGATADAVGRRLKSLAARAQVLVVTHSPQVAALGGHHWRVEKKVVKNQTLSTVTSLPPEARVEEIARMLAGDRITEAAREAARALLSA
ncbi:DNA repair protein RecN [Fuscibacter oryzae]|uniref:DNA repair protein RecN n=1 Tax=Fuscibacter oryzae TaxID=2803939 RepID=A0A8J7MXV1_9RHOB|nr:DNA repair protein RecN [Fuscibacter oryzae]MBL4929929.1 DNA repair protein RecN [Fuscibacter oryzae]